MVYPPIDMDVYIYTEAGSIFGWERKDKAQWNDAFFLFFSSSLSLFLCLSLHLSWLFARALDKDEKRRYQKKEENDDEQIMITEREWTYLDWSIFFYPKAASLFIEHHYCSSMPFLAWPTRTDREREKESSCREITIRSSISSFHLSLPAG